VEFLRDLGIAVIGGCVAGVLSPTVIFLVRQRQHQGEVVRMLRAFMTLSEREKGNPILDSKAAKQANIHDYVPVVERLWRRVEIVDAPGTGSYYYQLTPEGRQRASRCPWWRRWLGG
jgi:hypothetical protein